MKKIVIPFILLIVTLAFSQFSFAAGVNLSSGTHGVGDDIPDVKNQITGMMAPGKNWGSDNTIFLVDTFQGDYHNAYYEDELIIRRDNPALPAVITGDCYLPLETDKDCSVMNDLPIIVPGNSFIYTGGASEMRVLPDAPAPPAEPYNVILIRQDNVTLKNLIIDCRYFNLAGNGGMTVRRNGIATDYTFDERYNNITLENVYILSPYYYGIAFIPRYVDNNINLSLTDVYIIGTSGQARHNIQGGVYLEKVQGSIEHLEVIDVWDYCVRIENTATGALNITDSYIGGQLNSWNSSIQGVRIINGTGPVNISDSLISIHRTSVDIFNGQNVTVTNTQLIGDEPVIDSNPTINSFDGNFYSDMDQGDRNNDNIPDYGTQYDVNNSNAYAVNNDDDPQLFWWVDGTENERVSITAFQGLTRTYEFQLNSKCNLALEYQVTAHETDGSAFISIPNTLDPDVDRVTRSLLDEDTNTFSTTQNPFNFIINADASTPLGEYQGYLWIRGSHDVTDTIEEFVDFTITVEEYPDPITVENLDAVPPLFLISDINQAVLMGITLTASSDLDQAVAETLVFTAINQDDLEDFNNFRLFNDINNNGRIDESDTEIPTELTINGAAYSFAVEDNGFIIYGEESKSILLVADYTFPATAIEEASILLPVTSGIYIVFCLFLLGFLLLPWKSVIKKVQHKNLNWIATLIIIGLLLIGAIALFFSCYGGGEYHEPVAEASFQFSLEQSDLTMDMVLSVDPTQNFDITLPSQEAETITGPIHNRPQF